MVLNPCAAISAAILTTLSYFATRTAKFNPYAASKCKTCKSKVHQEGAMYCQGKAKGTVEVATQGGLILLSAILIRLFEQVVHTSKDNALSVVWQSSTQQSTRCLQNKEDSSATYPTISRLWTQTACIPLSLYQQLCSTLSTTYRL